MDLRRLGALEQSLRQHDHGEVPRRIDQPGRSEAAVPAERAGVRALGDDPLAEPPAAAVEKAFPVPRLLLGVS